MLADSINPEYWLDEHGDALYAFAMMRLGNSATAEDLLQDTLVAAMNSVDKFKGGASVRTWLVSILKNKIIDFVRKSSREAPLDLDVIDGEAFDTQFVNDGHWLVAPTDWGDPAKVIEDTELAGSLDECIGSLPEKLRTLLVLREIDGHETDELLSILNISSANNLWVMLSRGRDRIRKCLDAKINQ